MKIELHTTIKRWIQVRLRFLQMKYVFVEQFLDLVSHILALRELICSFFVRLYQFLCRWILIFLPLWVRSCSLVINLRIIWLKSWNYSLWLRPEREMLDCLDVESELTLLSWLSQLVKICCFVSRYLPIYSYITLLALIFCIP